MCKQGFKVHLHVPAPSNLHWRTEWFPNPFSQSNGPSKLAQEESIPVGYYLETVYASVLVATTRCYSWGVGGPQMNKFEQVSCDHHQISLAERVWCPEGRGAGVPHLTYPMMHLMLPTPTDPHEQTNAVGNDQISRWR